MAELPPRPGNASAPHDPPDPDLEDPGSGPDDIDDADDLDDPDDAGLDHEPRDPYQPL